MKWTRACSDNPRFRGLTSSVFDVYISFPQLFVLWNATKTIKWIILLFPLFHFLTKNFIRSSPFLFSKTWQTTRNCCCKLNAFKDFFCCPGHTCKCHNINFINTNQPSMICGPIATQKKLRIKWKYLTKIIFHQNTENYRVGRYKDIWVLLWF